MPSQTLYSLRTDGDQYRITKFIDGEVESSYLSTQYECECPAGHRPSCRHRQMIPDMLAHGIVDTHWFYNFDIRRVVDFNGMLKSNFDALNELAAPRDEYLEGIMNRDAVAEGPPSEAASTPKEAKAQMDKCEYWQGTKSLGKPWRRL